MASGGMNDDESKLRKKLIECFLRQDCTVDGDTVQVSFVGDCGDFGYIDAINISDLARDLLLEGVKP